MNQTALFPPDSPLGRAQQHRRSRVRLVFFIVVAFHVVLLFGLLIGGCLHPKPRAEHTSASATNALPSPAENSPIAIAPKVETNSPSSAVPPSAPLAAQAPASPPARKTYSVVNGDSFDKIAKARGITVSALMASNPGIEPTKLRVGQTLQLPAASGASAVPTARGAALPAQNSSAVYVVKPGDTLTRIARAHGTTVPALRAANGLKSDRVVVGQKLTLPNSAHGISPVKPPNEPAPVIGPP